MNRLSKSLSSAVKPLVLGMVHLKALPGSPLQTLSVDQIVRIALKEADILTGHHVDGIIIENMHDVPYVMSSRIGPETTAAMSVVCHEVRRKNPLVPIGIQILAGCNKEALAVALAADLDFVRVEGFIYSHVADEGIMNACAGDLLRYRAALNAQHISILADIKKKHSSHAITSDISIEQTAKDAQFFLADGVIVTGSSTGHPVDVAELKAVKNSVSIPVFVGSGATARNLHNYLSSDALIVGSEFKVDGQWSNEMDELRISSFMTTLNSAKKELLRDS